ncbi:MAG: hypothetical protein KME08_12515 [Aphanothece sp. CMT-3BRIN-NPC111]|nr:hypothetical protein [Aphanothece sp. CMT-3BRIN-NPC111]
MTLLIKLLKSTLEIIDPIALASTGSMHSRLETSVAFAACSKFRGTGSWDSSIPEWQSGIAGMFLIHPAPASKFIQGLRTDLGLQMTISTAHLLSASVILSNHLYPNLILASSEDTKRSIIPKKLDSISSLNAIATFFSSIIWEIKTKGLLIFESYIVYMPNYQL